MALKVLYLTALQDINETVLRKFQLTIKESHVYHINVLCSCEFSSQSQLPGLTHSHPGAELVVAFSVAQNCQGPWIQGGDKPDRSWHMQPWPERSSFLFCSCLTKTADL
jgi:hypothetical protein